MVDIRKRLREMVGEDVASGDITTKALIPAGTRASGEIVSRQHGVLAGALEVSDMFIEQGVMAEVLVPDGSEISPNTPVIRLEGPARKILETERTALNLLGRMSGIATATRELIERARKKNPKVTIAATRKTAPMLNYFDKRAVVAAGGEPHRYDLSEQILIKDNHLKLVGSVAEAVRLAKKARKGKVEIEVNDPADVMKAARAGADIIMLDNMTPVQIRRSVKALERAGQRGKVVLEASGGVVPANVGDYAATGVDVISSSYMTLKHPALDMSLELKSKDYKRGSGRK